MLLEVVKESFVLEKEELRRTMTIPKKPGDY